MRNFTFTILICLLFSSVRLPGQDLVYQPNNPAFGGNYLNYSWLLNSAETQNGFSADRDRDDLLSRLERDPLEDFAESMNRQVLSQISRRLFEKQFGEEGLPEGQYEIGNYSIEVSSTLESIQITILDTSTGSTTTVSVPYF